MDVRAARAGASERGRGISGVRTFQNYGEGQGPWLTAGGTTLSVADAGGFGWVASGGVKHGRCGIARVATPGPTTE
jgi:hypothetical protein